MEVVNMNVSREVKKEEAIKRMKVLGLFNPCIKAFKDRDEVQLSEQNGGLYEFNNNEHLNAIIENFEAQNNALVYHVIHTYTEFGELYNFLYVSDHSEEWDMDNADLADGYILAYVENVDDPICSEFGTIAVKGKFGGLVRIG